MLWILGRISAITSDLIRLPQCGEQVQVFVVVNAHKMDLGIFYHDLLIGTVCSKTMWCIVQI